MCTQDMHSEREERACGRRRPCTARQRFPFLLGRILDRVSQAARLFTNPDRTRALNSFFQGIARNAAPLSELIDFGSRFKAIEVVIPVALLLSPRRILYAFAVTLDFSRSRASGLVSRVGAFDDCSFVGHFIDAASPSIERFCLGTSMKVRVCQCYLFVTLRV